MFEKAKKVIKENYKSFLAGGLAMFGGLVLYGAYKSKNEGKDDFANDDFDNIGLETEELSADNIPMD